MPVIVQRDFRNVDDGPHGVVFSFNCFAAFSAKYLEVK